jgi:hypothetical protein
MLKNFRLRFAAAAATHSPFLLNTNNIATTLSVALSANTVSPLIDSFRLKRIEVRSLGNSGIAAPQTVALEWYGTSSSYRQSDTSISVAPAFIAAVPPPNCLASFWQLNDTNVSLCTVSYQIGAVLDLVLDIVLIDGTGVSKTSAVGGLTAATVYAKYLDGVYNTIAGTDWVPVGYANTVVD